MIIYRQQERKRDFEKMSIEKLCNRIGIKGLVNYGESDKYLSVRQHGVEYVYNKKTNALMVIYKDGSHLNIKDFA